MDLRNFQENFASMTILLDTPLSQYTFTKTGGPADALVFPHTKEEIKLVVDYVKQNDIPLTVLGNASNLIVRDGGIRGVVMMLTGLKKIVAENGKITADSGARIIDTSEAAVRASLSGLEFACGIPGSVGGAVYMNAGAYGGEITDCFESAEVITRAGEWRTLSHADMKFGYRHSMVQDSGDVVVSATFRLQEENIALIRAKMDDLMQRRLDKQPLEYPSCGSVFKRPAGHYTGQLIQEAGLQGLKWGGAQISTKHAGFIVNIEHATATDYVELIHHIQDVIWKKDQVRLETEVKIIGDEPEVALENNAD